MTRQMYQYIIILILFCMFLLSIHVHAFPVINTMGYLSISQPLNDFPLEYTPYFHVYKLPYLQGFFLFINIKTAYTVHPYLHTGICIVATSTAYLTTPVQYEVQWITFIRQCHRSLTRMSQAKRGGMERRNHHHRNSSLLSQIKGARTERKNTEKYIGKLDFQIFFENLLCMRVQVTLKSL